MKNIPEASTGSYLSLQDTLLPWELIVDNFAGGGGTSEGLEQAFGRPVDIAINHDPKALAMHRANHPHTKHYCESVWDVDPVEVTGNQPVGLVWLSPDCKHFSKAKGAKPVSKEIRGLAWVALRWALMTHPRVISLENVEEFVTWGPVVEDKPGVFKPCRVRKGETFEGFVMALSTGLPAEHPAMRDFYNAILKYNYDIEFKLYIYKKIKKGLGYEVDYKILKACDYGAPTIRKRLFLVARRDSLPIKWPEPTHGEPNSKAVKKGKLHPYRQASECIDWNIDAPSIFERKRPLADSTCKRVASGIMKYVVNNERPYVHETSIGCSQALKALPVLTECANSSSPRCMPIDEPLRTICASTKGGHHALIVPFIAKNYTGVIGSDIATPLHTVTATDHNSLVTSTLSINKNSSKSCEGHSNQVSSFLSVYYGNEKNGQAIDCPIRTVVGKSRFGLVTVHGIDYTIIDIGFRMLQPRELFKAQGFDDEYIIDYGYDHNGNKIKLTKTEQTRMVGNSVCPPVAYALIKANFTHEQEAMLEAS